MRIFYVDFENVKCQGLQGLSLLSETDKVIVLYSVNADSVKFSVVEEIRKSKAEIELKEVVTGTPNALDFQLISFLLLDYSSGNEIYIVSGDRGYDAVIRAVGSRGNHNLRRVPSIMPVARQPARQEQPVLSLPILPAVQRTEAAEPVPETTKVPVLSVISSDAPAIVPTVPADSKADLDSLDMSGFDFCAPIATDQPQEDVPQMQEPAPSPNPQPAKPKAKKKKSQKEAAKEELRKIIEEKCGKETCDKYFDTIRLGVGSCANKNQFYQFFRKQFGEKEGTALYRSIRSDFEKMRQLYLDAENASLSS